MTESPETTGALVRVDDDLPRNWVPGERSAAASHRALLHCLMSTTTPPSIAATADIDDRAEVGEGTVVWHLAQVREHARIGRRCTIGRGAYVGPGVVLGDHCKVQNLAQVYEPAVVEDGAFIGPAVVFTNDYLPRAVTPDGEPKSAAHWTAVGVHVKEGASIGARAVCVAPVTLGRWSMVAAGAVVIRDVPAFALVAGVPARRIGWVGRAGVPLALGGDGVLRCPVTGDGYVVEVDGLVEQVL